MFTDAAVTIRVTSEACEEEQSQERVETEHTSTAENGLQGWPVRHEKEEDRWVHTWTLAVAAIFALMEDEADEPVA